ARRNGQGRRLGVSHRTAPARRCRLVRERATLVRARAEGCGRRLPRARRGWRAVDARGRARCRPRAHAVRLRARREDQRLLGAVARQRLTGVLLVGGASSRFGSPKALAQFETLAERAWRVLGEACEERIAVGKAGDA